MKVVYVAGPFRGRTAWDVAQNIRAAEVLGLQVAEAGAVPLIPHANTANFNGTLTDNFWIRATAELLRRCDAMICTANWRESTGARGEVELAQTRGIPVFFDLAGLHAWLLVGV